MKCANCNQSILVGLNYPIGVPLPRILELYCKFCRVITLHCNPVFDQIEEPT